MSVPYATRSGAVLNTTRPFVIKAAPRMREQPARRAGWLIATESKCTVHAAHELMAQPEVTTGSVPVTPAFQQLKTLA